MREFENKRFPMHLADGIHSHRLKIPDTEAKAALMYIRQFVYRVSGRSELLHGYISESYLDALVRIREASSNRDFNSAVEAIGVDGETSTEVTEYTDDDFVLIELESSFEVENQLSSLTREHSSELSDEERTELYSIREIVENVNRVNTVSYYLPRTVFAEIAPLLDEQNLLL